LDEYKVSKLRKIIDDIRYYPMDILIGIRKHYLIFAAVLITSIVLPLLFVLPTCYTCITHHPSTFSTAFLRIVNPSGSLSTSESVCKWNTICHEYLTVPRDMSTSMIINFHSYSRKPSNAAVIFAEEGEENNAVTVQATLFRMNKIPLQQRYQYWADLTNLKPSTTYIIQDIVVTVSGKKLQRKSHYVIKFRTGPSTTSDDPFNFVSGGDIEWSESGVALVKEAALESPLFAFLGGDIAYENSFPSCYARLDDFFYLWNKHMVTPDNYSIPILSAIGNHEAGGFRMKRSDVHFYYQYFPHAIGLQNIAPIDRLVYHEHVFGKHTYMVILDSYVVTPIPGTQTEWLNQTLQSQLQPDNVNRIAAYHAAAYPVIDYELKEITQNIRKYFIPVLEQHNFKVVLEHHYHAFSESHPIKDGKVDEENGIRFLGAGCLGVPPRSTLVKNTSWWVKTVGSHAHYYSTTCTTLGCHATGIIYNPKTKQTEELTNTTF
jgi:hypothetical protein